MVVKNLHCASEAHMVVGIEVVHDGLQVGARGIDAPGHRILQTVLNSSCQKLTSEPISIPMKKTLLTILLPVSVALFGCSVGDPSSAEAAPKNPSASSSASYKLGVQRGFADGKGGLSRTPSRHESDYSQADRADFFSGYEAGYNRGIKPGASAPVKDAPYGQPLTALKGAGKVTIKEGKVVVTTLKTASPNVEETRFINEQEQIVVKSRGNHGPATVQLFNSRTGKEEGRVKAFEIKNGQPAWAAGMGE
jgi:hypothetical protein